jgi:hypothetical protein
MSKKPVKKNVKVNRDSVSGWEQAISDAELLIENLKGRITRLRGAILGFRDMRDQGVPWPGAEANIGEAKTETRRLHQE